MTSKLSMEAAAEQYDAGAVRPAAMASSELAIIATSRRNDYNCQLVKLARCRSLQCVGGTHIIVEQAFR